MGASHFIAQNEATRAIFLVSCKSYFISWRPLREGTFLGEATVRERRQLGRWLNDIRGFYDKREV